MASSSQLPSLHGIQVDPDVLSTLVTGSPQLPTHVDPHTARPAEQPVVLDVVQLERDELPIAAATPAARA